MFQTESIEKIDNSSFIMHFIDKHGKRWTEKLSKNLESYQTLDESQCQVKFNINTIAKTVFIDVTIKYPKNSIENENELNKLMKINEQRFIDFYNNELNSR